LSVSDDSELNKTQLKKKNQKKKMSFWTALALSFKNLLTKKGRTILVSIAGSIGIIGIALILAISSGFSTYINKMQEDTLSSTPITIESKNIDFTSVITQMFLDKTQNDKITHDKDGVYIKENISNVLNSVGNNLNANNLGKFYKHLNDNYDDIKEYVNGIQYTYDIGLEFYNTGDGTGMPDNVQPNSMALMDMVVKYALFYFEHQTNTIVTQDGHGCTIEATLKSHYEFVRQYDELKFIEEELIANNSTQLDSNEVYLLISKITGVNFASGSGSSSSNSAAMSFSQMKVFYEMLDNQKLIESQYELVGANSRYTQNKDEALLVLDKNHEVDDYILYALGLISDEQMDENLKGVISGDDKKHKIDYNTILENPIEYKIMTQSDYYFLDTNLNNYIDYRLYALKSLGKDSENNDIPNPIYNLEKYEECKTLFENSIKSTQNTVKIVGIVRPKSTTENGCLDVGVAYSNTLTDNLIDYYNSRDCVVNDVVKAIDKGNPTSINI
ncbi:MAG: hypothetical protein IKI95_09105, partial [Clostridia bacterium]|nr:hypothetical protein [Clostridia bacterium]